MTPAARWRAAQMLFYEYKSPRYTPRDVLVRLFKFEQWPDEPTPGVGDADDDQPIRLSFTEVRSGGNGQTVENVRAWVLRNGGEWADDIDAAIAAFILGAR